MVEEECKSKSAVICSTFVDWWRDGRTMIQDRIGNNLFSELKLACQLAFNMHACRQVNMHVCYNYCVFLLLIKTYKPKIL